jgi:hypothetical protein
MHAAREQHLLIQSLTRLATQNDHRLYILVVEQVGKEEVKRANQEGQTCRASVQRAIPPTNGSTTPMCITISKIQAHMALHLTRYALPLQSPCLAVLSFFVLKNFDAHTLQNNSKLYTRNTKSTTYIISQLQVQQQTHTKKNCDLEKNTRRKKFGVIAS